MTQPTISISAASVSGKKKRRRLVPTFLALTMALSTIFVMGASRGADAAPQTCHAQDARHFESKCGRKFDPSRGDYCYSVQVRPIGSSAADLLSIIDYKWESHCYGTLTDRDQVDNKIDQYRQGYCATLHPMKSIVKAREFVSNPCHKTFKERGQSAECRSFARGNYSAPGWVCRLKP